MIDEMEFRLQARQWLDTVEFPDVPLDLDGRFTALREWQRVLYDAGWLGLDWPIDAGGRGLTPLHQLAFAEEVARARAPQPIGSIGLDVVGPSIEKYGAPWQRRELLPRLLSGEDIWCQGFSEPGSGSDLASLRTSARIDGDRFVINGQKVWTSWAMQAQWCALLVRTDADAPKHQGISYVLVDLASPGVNVRPLVQMTGDEEFCEVFFSDVEVPLRNLVGELNQGWTIANHTLGVERGSYTVRRRVDFELALEDVISDVALTAAAPDAPELPQRVYAAIGKARVGVAALEAQTRKTVDRLARNVGPTAEDSVDKLLLNSVEQSMYEAIVDLLGPLRAAPNAHPFGIDAGRWIRDHYYSRAVSIYGGTEQIQRNIVARRLLGLPRD